jgi:hypothetical protein
MRPSPFCQLGDCGAGNLGDRGRLTKMVSPGVVQQLPEARQRFGSLKIAKRIDCEDLHVRVL